MAMNKIQFQKGLSLPEFLEMYGTEELCEEALERFKWPDGFSCQHCNSQTYSNFEREGHKIWQCSHCRHQHTLRSGTLFHRSKLPLTKWLLAVYMITQSKTNVSALELKRFIGVCYRTAWRVKQKILQVMKEQEDSVRLSSFVQVDDAYFGGERNGGKRGRGSENKTPFVVAVEVTMEGYPLYATVDPVKGFTNKALKEWAQRRLEGEVDVYSDGLMAFATVIELGHAHTVIQGGTIRERCETESARWVNIFLSNLKRAIDGTYHFFKYRKYAKRYCAEATWRFNRRFDLRILVPELFQSLVRHKPYNEVMLRDVPNCYS